jgi:beta-lactam-binding protein with PASTA domain
VPGGSANRFVTSLGRQTAATFLLGASRRPTRPSGHNGRVDLGRPARQHAAPRTLVATLTNLSDHVRKACLTLGLAACVPSATACASGSPKKPVIVPNEVKRTVQVAQLDVQNNHLQPNVVRVVDPTVAIDTVVRQDPAADKIVLRGSTITLFVSSGPAVKAIPFDITTGRTAADVTTELKNLGFVVAIKQQPNATHPGTVITSIPSPGTNANVGSTVTIFVSSGPTPGGE